MTYILTMFDNLKIQYFLQICPLFKIQTELKDESLYEFFCFNVMTWYIFPLVTLRLLYVAMRQSNPIYMVKH